MTSPASPAADVRGTVRAPPVIERVEVVDRKMQKREAKRQRDAQRAPDSFERFKVLFEVIGQQRHVVDLEDHRARYALIIMGVINAGVVVLASHAVGSGLQLEAVPHWLLGVVLVYLAATLAFILVAVDSLRPRALDPKGLLHWEGALRHDVAEYQRAWSVVRMDQLNQEAVLIAHMLAGMIHKKYRANCRLYAGLPVLLALGSVLLVVLGIFFLPR